MAGEGYDPVAEGYRLAHVVGDEDDGGSLLLPQLLKYSVQLLAGRLVECGERFVH